MKNTILPNSNTTPTPETSSGPTKLNRERAATAAVEANYAYGQWMPEQWLHLFLNSYERLSR